MGRSLGLAVGGQTIIEMARYAAVRPSVLAEGHKRSRKRG